MMQSTANAVVSTEGMATPGSAGTGVYGHPQGQETRPMPRLTSTVCECAACGEFFGGTRAFDMHRYTTADDRRACRSRDWMHDTFRLDERGIWRQQTSERLKEMH